MAEINIPPLATVMMRVMRFDPVGEQSDTGALELIIKPDKAVCSEIMRVANSAYYGRAGAIKNLADAITLIGLKGVKNLAILVMTRQMGHVPPGEVVNRYVNIYPVMAALIAQDLANQLGLKDLVEPVFVSTILHRVGMTLLALEKKEHYAFLLEQAEQGSMDLLALEREAYKENHTDLTMRAFKHWQLPDEFTELADNLAFPPGTTASQTDLTRVTVLAGLLSEQHLKMTLNEDVDNRRASIFAHYGDDQKLQTSLNDDYFDLLRAHPFVAQVAGAQ